MIGDLLRWLGEVWDGLAPASPPRSALAVGPDGPALMRLGPGGYEFARPAAPGDWAPLLLSDEQALALELETPAAVAKHGLGAARIEAARRSPFPLETADWALAPAPAPWGETARFRFAAAPKARLAELQAAVAARGARPGPAFALVSGAPLALGAARPKGPIIALAALLLAALAAAGSAEYAGAAREVEATAQLDAARAALDRAEAEAEAAAAARETEAAPIRAAAAGAAMLRAAPPAAESLARLAAATPDGAHALRLTIRPGRVSGDFAAPDAAALAQRLGAADGFAGARLTAGARSEGALQRASLELTTRPE